MSNRSANAIDVTEAARLYRRIWRCCFLAGVFGLATITPLISAAQVELEMMGGAATGTGIADAVGRGVVPTTIVQMTIVAIALFILTCVGRFAPWRMMSGVVLLAIGAALVLIDDWIVVKDAWRPSEWSIASLYTVLEAGVWLVCAMAAIDALVRLAASRPEPRGERMLPLMTAFEQTGRSRRRRHRTFRPSRLAWMLVGLAASVLVTIALQVGNAIVFQQWVLRFPSDLYRKREEQIAFVIANPGIAIAAAIGDIVQVVLTIAAVSLILRFFWRLVVADAARLLADPTYRPIVFLRSFVDDAATVTSKRVLDRLVRRRRRLEEIAVAALAPLGTAIAIGQPGERLPRLGAIRAYYGDDEWQAAVLEWMSRAQLIVLIGGPSHWTLWELRRALDRGCAERLLLVLPPDRDEAARLARWQALVETAADTAWEPALRAMPPAGVIALVLAREAEVVPIIGDGRLQADYEAAIRLAALELLPAP